ncbi:MAG: PEP-utilizing enzyme [Propionibacteriaceae bacterium]|nr:PEP-utilizing enzyme [Propionibacteriaceae bacterium]
MTSPLIALDAQESREKVGGKAHHLGVLMNAGFTVPAGWVIPVGVASPGNIPPDLMVSLDRLPEGSYAVRSSAVHEDLGAASFAGQYDTILNVPKDGLASAIEQCLSSATSPTARAYLSRYGLDNTDMAVIIQTMVKADYAGVAFTVNPLTGADTQLVIEYVPGLGDALVSGQVTPATIVFDWLDRRWLDKGIGDLPEGFFDELVEVAAHIQQHYGYPIDLEFAYEEGQLWVLQVRPVTSIMHAGLTDMWSTADFKDGGVSAGPCQRYMWSLYQYIWEHALGNFVVDSKLVTRKNLRPLGGMFYSRPYWNLSMVKEIMSGVPGYVERDFDEEYGVAVPYDGDGRTTKLTPRTLIKLLPTAIIQSRMLKERERDAHQLAQQIKELIADRLATLDELTESGEGLPQAFQDLTRDDYLFVESTYFLQIFLNTVHQSLFRDAVWKHTDLSGYLELIGGLEDISHLRPVVSLWELSRHHRLHGRVDEDALQQHLTAYGYHSDRELDVGYPNYWEDPEPVRRQLSELSELGDDHDPRHAVARQHEAYLHRLSDIEAASSARKGRSFRKRVERMRTLLWWREEFRDLSTRFYDVIRRYTLALGRLYVARGILDRVEDIFHLRVETLWAFHDGTIDADQVRHEVDRNSRYFSAYRNYLSDNEIGSTLGPTPPRTDGVITGLGCSSGRVTARACVVSDLSELGRIRPGDILVTRFTDTGWTPCFSSIAAVVTEYGGLLCHAAIVSREYGIACVVHATGVLDAVRDGQIITIDGEQGTIQQ